MEKVAVRVLISGKVQGVFFRDSAKKKADDLDIVGWIKNLEDGRVEALIEGDREKVESMIQWIKQGPENARVDKTEIIREKHHGSFKNFKIIF